MVVLTAFTRQVVRAVDTLQGHSGTERQQITPLHPTRLLLMTSPTSGTTFRLASYAVCVRDGAVLLVAVEDNEGEVAWTLPGGGVEPLEDPLAAVTREVAEETGCTSRVVSLLGVDSRVIPQDEAIRGVPHQNVGIFYEVELTRDELRAEPSGDTVTPTWVPRDDVETLSRSGLVDIGLTLVAECPPSGHVPPVTVGGLVRH